MMDELYMMGDDPSVYLSPPDSLAAPLISTEKILMEQSGLSDDDVIITNSTNQMLDVVNNNNNNNNNSNKRQRKGNRRQNNNNQQRNRNRNSNNQNDGTSFDDNNPINVISAFNRTGKIYNKLRKNDAVKVIDTPSGRAGFVYQSGTSSSSSGSSSINSNVNNQDSPMSTSIKESNSNNWEDPYSQNQFVNRNANDVKLIPSDDTSNKKILPVLTSDGKIALVVRGDTSRYFDESQNNGSGNSINSKKYEPITNLTSIITALNSNNDNNNFNKHNDSINVSDTNVELKSIQEQNRLINRLDEFFASVTNKVKHIEEELEHKLGIDLEEDDSNDGREKIAEDSDDESFQVDQMTTTTTTMEPFIDEDDKDRKDLLLINRPLSEVLGLPKKTHYHHPHDPMHTTPTEIPYIRQSNENRRTHTSHKTSSTHRSSEISSTTTLTTTTSTTTEEFDLESPEKINIAVIPRFDSELEERLFGKSHDNLNRNVNEKTNEIPDTSGAISSIHCAMQVMIAIACACTIFGVLGAYYRNHIVNQIRIIHW